MERYPVMNKKIICIQCEREFEFSINEQLRCKKMNFDIPKRCPDCRKKKLKISDDQNKNHLRNKRHDKATLFKYE
jgi:hypothetical protein